MNTRPPKLEEAISTPSVRTLVVDDSPFMLRILAQILQEAGKFDLVGTATDGYQALRYVSELSPELVLMDFHLPHLNGIQATRSIKGCEHPPLVIIITSDDSSGTRSMAEEAGADAFIVKTGSLYLRLARTLQNLFGPRGERRAAVDPGNAAAPGKTPTLGSAQRQDATFPHTIQHGIGHSPCWHPSTNRATVRFPTYLTREKGGR